MVLLGDEVWGNLYITVYGGIGEDKLLFWERLYCENKSNKKKHFTVIGLTKLLCEPIFCILIIEGKEQLFDIWDGIYLSKEKVGYESYGEECFRMNVGYGNYHPGGTSCT